MKTVILAAGFLLVGAGLGQAQSILPCADNGAATDTATPCTAPPSYESTLNAAGTFDQGSTSAIASQPLPAGMTPLVVPVDPLGKAVGQNPITNSTALNAPLGIGSIVPPVGVPSLSTSSPSGGLQSPSTGFSLPSLGMSSSIGTSPSIGIMSSSSGIASPSPGSSSRSMSSSRSIR